MSNSRKIILSLIIFILVGIFIIQPVIAQDNNFTIKCLANGKCGNEGGLIKFLQNSNYTLPLVAVAGAIDGINPCAIGMLILLLGYLLVFAKKPEMMKKIGIIYIATIFITYLMIGLVFTQTISYLINLPYYQQLSQIIKYLILGLLIFTGLVNIKDFFWYRKGLTLGVGKKQVPILMKYIKEVSIGATIVLGFLVTIFEMPCSLPLYVGTITILSGFFNIIKIFLYLLVYNIMFILPISIVFIILLYSEKIFEAKDLQERSNRYMKLLTGLSQVLIAIILYFI